LEQEKGEDGKKRVLAPKKAEVQKSQQGMDDACAPVTVDWMDLVGDMSWGGTWAGRIGGAQNHPIQNVPD